MGSTKAVISRCRRPNHVNLRHLLRLRLIVCVAGEAQIPLDRHLVGITLYMTINRYALEDPGVMVIKTECSKTELGNSTGVAELVPATAAPRTMEAKGLGSLLGSPGITVLAESDDAEAAIAVIAHGELYDEAIEILNARRRADDDEEEEFEEEFEDEGEEGDEDDDMDDYEDEDFDDYDDEDDEDVFYENDDDDM